MSKGWSQFSKKAKEQGAENTTAHLTMNLRCVVYKGEHIIEQLVEHRNSNGMVVTTEWVAIPVIYTQE